jgi:hypothetical protein
MKSRPTWGREQKARYRFAGAGFFYGLGAAGVDADAALQNEPSLFVT